MVLVSGDAGVGKTTLVAEAARRARWRAPASSWDVARRTSARHAPFAEALHHFVAHAPEHVLRTHVETHGGDIASMVPALVQRLGGVPAPTRTDPDTERYLLYGAVAGLLTAASAIQPTVLVLDDLQWSDSRSLRLLRHIVATSSRHGYSCSEHFDTPSSRLTTRSVISSVPGNANQILVGWNSRASMTPACWHLWRRQRDNGSRRLPRISPMPSALRLKVTRFSSERCCGVSWRPAPSTRTIVADGRRQGKWPRWCYPTACEKSSPPVSAGSVHKLVGSFPWRRSSDGISTSTCSTP